jgi:hypothetical protein
MGCTCDGWGVIGQAPTRSEGGCCNRRGEQHARSCAAVAPRCAGRCVAQCPRTAHTFCAAACIVPTAPTAASNACCSLRCCRLPPMTAVTDRHAPSSPGHQEQPPNRSHARVTHVRCAGSLNPEQLHSGHGQGPQLHHSSILPATASPALPTGRSCTRRHYSPRFVLTTHTGVDADVQRAQQAAC